MDEDDRDDRWLYSDDPDGTWWVLRAVGAALGLTVACVVLAAWLGCAAATVDPDGTVRGVALAGGSVERCVPRGEAGLIASAPQECVRVVAQSLPSAVFGLLGQAAAALWALF